VERTSAWPRKAWRARSETTRAVASVAKVFESHGYAVRQTHTTRPGYVVYEDEVQVTAMPFREGGEE
jgi:hypothetical protein